MAAVKLLGGPKASKASRRSKSAYVLGEIGSGKTVISLDVASTIGARTVLVMCPPHLLDSWRDEVGLVIDARVVVLSNIADVDALKAEPTVDGRMTVAVMSREAAAPEPKRTRASLARPATCGSRARSR